jgi:hypothetical protein
VDHEAVSKTKEAGSALARRAGSAVQGPPGGAHADILGLQSAIGNRATARMLSRRTEPGSMQIQRRMSITHSQLAEQQTAGEKAKSAISANTYAKLIVALKKYQASKDPKVELALVDTVLGLAGLWQMNHTYPSKNDRKKLALVQDLEAEARRERGQLQAMAKYLEEAKGGKLSGLSDMAKNLALPQAGDLAAGKAKKGFGTGEDTLALIQELGLSEAEMAAVKTYTASDYTYINPATANVDSWLKGQNKDKISEANEGTDLKKLKEEGAMQAGALMMALMKMPPTKTTAYRGARVSAGEFNAKYGSRQDTVFTTFSSTSMDAYTAERFADGRGEVVPRNDQTVRVLCTLDVTNGRDLSKISVYGAAEKEVLLLPGATFKIAKITEEKTGPEGRPPATRWVTIRLTQTK